MAPPRGEKEASNAGDKMRYRGVRKRPSERYGADITDPRTKRRVWLGTFETGEEAARAYDAATRRFRSWRAKTNFPPPEPSRSTTAESSSNGRKTASPVAPSLSLDIPKRFPFQDGFIKLLPTAAAFSDLKINPVHTVSMMRLRPESCTEISNRINFVHRSPTVVDDPRRCSPTKSETDSSSAIVDDDF